MLFNRLYLSNRIFSWSKMNNNIILKYDNSSLFFWLYNKHKLYEQQKDKICVRKLLKYLKDTVNNVIL